MVRWGSARPPRQPAELDATYHSGRVTPIIFFPQPSAIVSTDPLRPRTYSSLDVTAASPFEVRGDFGITNEVCETTPIEAENVADRSASFQQFIGNRFAPQHRARVAIKSRPSISSEACDRIERSIIQPRRPIRAPDRAPIARSNCPNERHG